MSMKNYKKMLHTILNKNIVGIGKDQDFILGIKDSEDKVTTESKLTYGQVYNWNKYLDYNGDGMIQVWETAKRIIDCRNYYFK
jgi:hypothetical protein